MIVKHEQLVRQAAQQRVQVICFQELFHGRYFGSVQDAMYYEYDQRVPGPIRQRFEP